MLKLLTNTTHRKLLIRSVPQDRVQPNYTPLSILWTASGQDSKVSLPRGCFLEKLRYHLCSKTLSFSWSWRGKIWVTIPLDMHLGTVKGESINVWFKCNSACQSTFFYESFLNWWLIKIHVHVTENGNNNLSFLALT